MFVAFWGVVLLAALLLSRNARYAFRQYLANRHVLLFSVYMAFLAGLGVLVVHATSRLIDILQNASQTAEITPPSAYVQGRLKGQPRPEDLP